MCMNRIDRSVAVAVCLKALGKMSKVASVGPPSCLGKMFDYGSAGVCGRLGNVSGWQQKTSRSSICSFATRQPQLKELRQYVAGSESGVVRCPP